jgi:PhzF family phenazine biosynthesis protein
VTQPIYVADAFTDRPFAGNPAAVCPLPGPAGEEWMRRVAVEMNLSETAFLSPEGDAWRLRWFTPAVEVDLCGHATLASAHILWETGLLARDRPARFLTRSGLLAATPSGDLIEMDFPARPATPCAAPDGLADALGTSPVSIGANGMDYLVELADEAAVRGLRPDFGKLQHLPVRGVIVTARASAPGPDFVSRFFAPGAGINEDPVTGSAHCALGPFWAGRLGRVDMVGYQASARGGTVRVGVRGDRVLLAGRAVTVWRGELLHPPG